MIDLSVLLRNTIDASDFQQLLIKISKEEIDVVVEVEGEANSQEEEYHRNDIEEDKSSDEDEFFYTSSSSDESIIDL